MDAFTSCEFPNLRELALRFTVDHRYSSGRPEWGSFKRSLNWNLNTAIRRLSYQLESLRINDDFHVLPELFWDVSGSSSPFWPNMRDIRICCNTLLSKALDADMYPRNGPSRRPSPVDMRSIQTVEMVSIAISRAMLCMPELKEVRLVLFPFQDSHPSLPWAPDQPGNKASYRMLYERPCQGKAGSASALCGDIYAVHERELQRYVPREAWNNWDKLLQAVRKKLVTS